MITFTATVDRVIYTTDNEGEPIIAAIHLSHSDIGLDGTIMNYDRSNNVIFDDDIISAAPPMTTHQPFDVTITIKPNDGNPYINNDNIIKVEVN